MRHSARDSAVTIVYDKRLVSELEKLDRATAIALIRQIKLLFQLDWEKLVIFRRDARHVRFFDTPPLGGFILVGCKLSRQEVLLLGLR